MRIHVPQPELVEHVDAKYKELYFFQDGLYRYWSKGVTHYDTTWRETLENFRSNMSLTFSKFSVSGKL